MFSIWNRVLERLPSPVFYVVLRSPAAPWEPVNLWGSSRSLHRDWPRPWSSSPRCTSSWPWPSLLDTARATGAKGCPDRREEQKNPQWPNRVSPIKCSNPVKGSPVWFQEVESGWIKSHFLHTALCLFFHGDKCPPQPRKSQHGKVWKTEAKMYITPATT